MYIGEIEHIRCVRTIFCNSRVHFVAVREIVNMEAADSYKNFLHYFRLLNSVVTKYEPRIIFILCGYRPCLFASEWIAIIHRRVKVYFVLHGMVEKNKGCSGSYMKLLRFGRHCKRIQFISYSPYCTGRYWGICENKMVFLHHPYVRKDYTEPKVVEKDGSDKVIIGVIGACANDKAVKLIVSVNRKAAEHNYEFWVASRFGKKFQNLENVKVLNLEFSRKRIEKLMRKIDFMLMPYGRDEYMMSASGVLWDAIINRLPCLMLDSDYFKYYMSYQIGYQADSIEGLSQAICEILQRKRDGQEKFFVNMDRIASENNETVSALLYCNY